MRFPPLRSLLPRRRRPPPRTQHLVDDGSLAVVGGSFDPATADSAVIADLEASGVDPGRNHLVRHHLRLPDDAAVEQARAIVAQDGYTVHGERPAGEGTPWVVRASRTEALSGRSLAQERTRMAGLAQRLGGTALGWDACAAPTEDSR